MQQLAAIEDKTLDKGEAGGRCHGHKQQGKVLQVGSTGSGFVV